MSKKIHLLATPVKHVQDLTTNFFPIKKHNRNSSSTLVLPNISVNSSFISAKKSPNVSRNQMGKNKILLVSLSKKYQKSFTLGKKLSVSKSQKNLNEIAKSSYRIGYVKWPNYDEVEKNKLFHAKNFELFFRISQIFESKEFNQLDFGEETLENSFDQILSYIEMFYKNLAKIFPINSYINQARETSKDNFYKIFTSASICILYKKIFKILILYFAILLFIICHYDKKASVVLRFLNESEGLKSIFSQMKSSLFMFYSMFLHDEIGSKIKNLNSQKVYNYKSQHKSNEISQILHFIDKGIENCVNNLKNFINITFKYQMQNPFVQISEEITKVYDNCSVKFLYNLIYYNILYSEITSMNVSKSSCVHSNLKEGCLLPPKKSYFDYTLVVDLDETLIHFFNTNTYGIYFLRPFCLQFLRELSESYEIIIFTAGTKQYADKIIDGLDPSNSLIKHRLYRDHMNNSFKDLSRIGRDLKKTIILDNIEDNYSLQPDNGLQIKSWKGDDINDMELNDIKKLLLEIKDQNFDDIRRIVRNINSIIKNTRCVRPYADIDVKTMI